ncbi:DMT family transporter [Pseudomaricurvus alcaniphilus]|uniref:DMT family transporter n=1 Tax=Pseudomaricurvus alcaniphilus TaxID=1166482 RepID=UPI001407578A|nr:DMT family transporter [Pseudomaricurvus alcaniphilus]NHN37166.1 DMT family transporter [Pseudomaricurvus alcaniphilus]
MSNVVNNIAVKTIAGSSVTAQQAPPSRRVALTSLLGAGLLLGFTTNLAKVAHGLALAPLVYLLWSLLGAALILVLLAALRGQVAALNRRSLEYFVVAGFLTTAGANLIFFSAVPHLGVSFVAMMIAVPPLLTYVGALWLGMERFNWWRATGVLLALVGTVLLVARQWLAPDADIGWIALTLLGPVLLTAGNIYRSRRWPPGASAESLAPGMLVAAAAMLIVYGLALGERLTLASYSSENVGLIMLQALVFAGQFQLMFVLQKSGGPVFISLMGGVSVVFGVPIATGLLGEPLLPGFLVSAVLVAAGIVSQLKGWSSGVNKPLFRAAGGRVK